VRTKWKCENCGEDIKCRKADDLWEHVKSKKASCSLNATPPSYYEELKLRQDQISRVACSYCGRGRGRPCVSSTGRNYASGKFHSDREYRGSRLRNKKLLKAGGINYYDY